MEGRLNRVCRVARISRLSGGRAAAPTPAHVILTVADDLTGDGVAQVTTAAPHGLADLAPVIISGNSNAAYNGSWLAGVAGADNPATQFWILDSGTTLPIVFAGSGVGGTWA